MCYTADMNNTNQLTMNEAATIIGVTRQTIYDRMKAGLIAAGTSPLDIVKQEMARKRQELADIERKLSAFTTSE